MRIFLSILGPLILATACTPSEDTALSSINTNEIAAEATSSNCASPHLCAKARIMLVASYKLRNPSSKYERELLEPFFLQAVNEAVRTVQSAKPKGAKYLEINDIKQPRLRITTQVMRNADFPRFGVGPDNVATTSQISYWTSTVIGANTDSKDLCVITQDKARAFTHAFCTTLANSVVNNVSEYKDIQTACFLPEQPVDACVPCTDTF